MENNNQENEVSNNSGLSDFSVLKKRKKKVRFNLDEIHSVKLPVTETPFAPLHCNEIHACETDLSFDLLKKRKKKKVNAQDLSNISENNNTIVEKDKSSGISDIWNKDHTAEYEYVDLLTRVYNIMRRKDPSIDLQTKKKLVMKPPQVIRIGTKKSSFVNFIDICKMLHRTPQHVQSFLLVELGTSGSIDGNNQLIIKGRFEQKQMESVLRSYIKEYVTCHTCRSPDTFLQKDTRLFFLQCESCGSRCSVANIKSGFQAVTSKRAAMRAKAN